MTGYLKPYISLMNAFTAGDISADEFETKYIKLFKDDGTFKSNEIFSILDKVFSDVDAYCSDPNLRTPDDLDEMQLREQVAIALQQLERFPNS